MLQNGQQWRKWLRQRWLNNDELVRLGDIAVISKEPVTPIEEIILVDGKQTVMVAISGTMSQRVGDYVAKADAIAEKLNQ